MKRRRILLAGIIFVSIILSSLSIYSNFKINQSIAENNIQKSNLQEDVFTELGLLDPFEEDNDGKGIADMKTIHKVTFEKLKDLIECSDIHMDITKPHVEEFLDSMVHEWYPNDWQKIDDGYYEVDFTDGTKGYGRKMEYYSPSSMDASESKHLHITLDYDAVSERIHSISFMLPYADNSKVAFLNIMAALGMERTDANAIFDKMLTGIQQLGNNEHAKYKENGYKFYMSEYDLNKGKDEKCYYMSISAYDTADK